MSNREKLAQVLEQIPGVLRQLSGEVKDLREKVANYEQREKAEALVAEMEEKGLIEEGVPHHEKVASLLNSGKDLDVLREAVGMQVGDFSSASVSGRAGSGSDELTQFLVT